MPQPDITLKGKTGIPTIARGCAVWVSDTETVGDIVTAIAEPISGVSNRALVVTDRELSAGKTCGGFAIGGHSGAILLRAGAAGVTKGNTLAIADTQGRWRPATATDQWVPYMSVNDGTADALFLAIPHTNLPLYSEVRTGTGAEESIAHGLRRIPRAVRWRLCGTNGVLALLNIAVTPGTHDATNVKITVTAGVRYQVEAWI